MNKPAIAILIVDDEPQIRRFLRTSLTAQVIYRRSSRQRTAQRRWPRSSARSPIW